MTEERNTAGNTGLAKVAVQCSADTFVVNQTLVLRINICGENRQLLVAAKRCQWSGCYHRATTNSNLHLTHGSMVSESSFAIPRQLM